MIIAVATVVVVAATLGSSMLQTPVYQALSRILLQPRTTESLFNPCRWRRYGDPVRARTD